MDGTREYGGRGRRDQEESDMKAGEKSLHSVVVSIYFGHNHGLQHRITEILSAYPLHGPLISL